MSDKRAIREMLEAVDVKSIDLDMMVRNILDNPKAWHPHLKQWGRQYAQMMPSDVGSLLIAASTLGVQSLVEFLNSPQHKAVKRVLHEMTVRYGGDKRRAKQKLRSKLGGFFWRRKIRQRVKEQLSTTRKQKEG